MINKAKNKRNLERNKATDMSKIQRFHLTQQINY